MPSSAGKLPPLLLFLLLVCSRRHSALSSDGLSLLAFKTAITSDPTSALVDWDPADSDPCRWSGVSCANLSGFPTPRVVSVSLSSRNLSGYVPSELGTLLFLRRLNLHGNLLTGSIPPRLSNASSLHSIFLYSNNLTGQLPPELFALPRLRNLDLSHNSLSGEIPPGIRNCRNLQRLVLANNHFAGGIPVGAWSALESLMELDLSSNFFSGLIPPDLGEMKSMTGVMNLSHNRFAGEIPASLGRLPAVVTLDLRSNDLSGEIPRNGALEDQGTASFLGNPHLCGVPLPVICKNTAASASARNRSVGRGGGVGRRSGNTNEKVDRRKGPSMSVIILISAADAVGVALIGLILFYIIRKVKNRGKGCRSNTTGGGILHDAEGEGSIWRRLSRLNNHVDDELESRTMSSEGGEGEGGGRLVALDKTLELGQEELLGASAYVLGRSGSGVGGMVYKVVLGSGVAVAVRRLGEVGLAAVGGRYKEFASEARAMATVRHPNVVRLRAFYWSQEEKLLVSDYVDNGNLASVLIRGGRSSEAVLSWAARLRIARGTARGLAHLHGPRKFVHGNLKPSNILLDRDFNPRISDFGLARLAASDGGRCPMGSATTDRPNKYRAPEAWLPTSRPTQKWDVYSFGVILLEIVTGRSPETPTSSSSSLEAGGLVGWVRKGLAFDRPLAEMVDAPILNECLCDAARKDVFSTLQIALACAETDPETRPRMKAVYDKLARIGRR